MHHARSNWLSLILLLSLCFFGLNDHVFAADPVVSLRMEQAPDAGCDDALDDPFSTATISIPPGNNCVLYRLTAVNSSLEPAFNVVVSDSTPIFTTYQKLLGCSQVDCTITEPAIGGVGLVAGEVAVLNPGESLELIFAVKLD